MLDRAKRDQAAMNITCITKVSGNSLQEIEVTTLVWTSLEVCMDLEMVSAEFDGSNSTTHTHIHTHTHTHTHTHMHTH